MARWLKVLLGGITLVTPIFALAKPIAFANGTTVMVEYGADTMKEAQVFYAPRYNWSWGLGRTEFDSDESRTSERITYARLNYLAHRWNLETAQANIFVWGGAGAATGTAFRGMQLAGNAGAQSDYETRRVYASFKTDWQAATAFRIRVDTLQLGLAPYRHDYNELATWFVVQARHYTGDIHRGIEKAALLRLFRGGAWIEAGITTDHTIQAMAMFNF